MKNKRMVARVLAIVLCGVFLLTMFSVVIRGVAEESAPSAAAVTEAPF